MARITVEDCLQYVDNRFELVMLGSRRARQIAIGGQDPMVPRDNDKPTVLALREIEEGLIDLAVLQKADEEVMRAARAAVPSEPVIDMDVDDL